MKKLILLTALLLLFIQSSDAGIISTILGNNQYYYRPARINRYYNNPYSRRYRHRHVPYRNRYYYNQKPIIYRNTVRRTQAEFNEKLVSSEFSGIGKIERKILSQTYEYDTVKNRIERLEQKMFGTVQSGSLEDRLSILKNASKNYMSFNPDYNYHLEQGYNPYGSYRSPIFTGSTGTSWKNNLLGNFRNQLMGVPTGFTPAMDPAYMDYFEAEREMSGMHQNGGYTSNNGWGYSNIDRRTGTSVKLLD